MPNHGVTCNIGSAKLCSAAIFKTYMFSLITRIYGLLHQINMYFLLFNCTISCDSYTSINKFYSFVIFSLLINAVI